jgi:hypothetical protein
LQLTWRKLNEELKTKLFQNKIDRAREMIEAITMIHNDARYTNYFMNNAIINNLAESRKKQTRADYLQLSPRDLKLLKFRQ